MALHLFEDSKSLFVSRALGKFSDQPAGERKRARPCVVILGVGFGGFRNRFAVSLNWLWANFTYDSSMRLNTGCRK